MYLSSMHYTFCFKTNDMARHQLAVAAFFASVVLLLSKEATAVVVGTLNLQREALAPYISRYHAIIIMY